MIKNRGLTLIELLMCLLMVAILSVFCLPSGLSLRQKNQLQIMASELGTAVRYARNQALLEGRPLVLTPLPDSKDWSRGMILFIDNKKHRYTPGDKLIHQWQWQHPDVRVEWHGFYSDHYLLFSAELQQAALNGHFDIQAGQGKTAKLVLNRFGRITLTRSSLLG